MSDQWKYGLLGIAAVAGMAVASPPADAAPAVSKASSGGSAIVAVKLQPATLTFANKRDVRRVLVLGVTKDGYQVDLTDKARLTPQGGFVQAHTSGFLSPAKVGSGVVEVAAAGKRVKLPV
ncbi:MAG TPA: hypothetical protein VK689_02925, partial [Armatimonadota bacterium]|nr:hypothetical protein [Armatimonadota bacterium]